METLTIKCSTKEKTLPLQPIRLCTPGWSGEPAKMEDGAPIQPWHCLPFVEGSTYGLELIYPHQNECQVVNDNGAVRFDWDFMNEPGEPLTGGEFLFFSPMHAPKYYLFNTRLDVQAPPGHVLRTEPHPRFFTDDSGTVPMPMIGHLQNEWYPRQLFVVFRVPRPGQRHIFRKGEPYAQLLFVPQRMKYEITRLSMEEQAHRRDMEKDISFARTAIATNRWNNSTGNPQDNHYKILAAAFARGGQTAVEEVVRVGVDRQKQGISQDQTIAECMAKGGEKMKSQQYSEAGALFSHVLSRDPNNAEAMHLLGLCVCTLGNFPIGLNMVRQAIALKPNSPAFHYNLGGILQGLGRFQEAEAAFRTSLHLNANDPTTWSLLGLTLAQQGRLVEGMEACQSAVAMDKTLPASHLRLGLVLAQLEKKDEARSAYETALALNPEFGDARRALQHLLAKE